MNADFLWHYMQDMSDEQKWQCIRGHRDSLINKIQWVLNRHTREQEMILLGTGITKTSLTDDQIIKVYQYIQTLADIPQTFINPDDVVFPVSPMDEI